MGSTPFLTPVFIFGSIRGGSGKSSIVAHLSVYLQSKGRRVAIIDANSAFPNQLRSVLPRSVSLECYTDLTELVIEGSSRFRRTFVFTATDKISYFPSFKLKDPVRLLSDASLRDFFLQLRSHFDVVLINLPPGCDNFVVAETFMQRRGNDAGAPAAVLVTNTDVRSLTLLDSMLRSRPALFHFARERLMFIYNMLPRGIEDTTIDKARMGWNETRRLFRLPISLGISVLDEFSAQAKAAAPLVFQDKSLLRQTMATLSRTLLEVAEGQWQGDPMKSESDDFSPCLDSFLLEKLSRHIDPLQKILARRLCTHGATISSFIETSPTAYRFRLRLSGVGRRSLPPVLDIHHPSLVAVTDGRIPGRFAWSLEYAPPPIVVQDQYLDPAISAKPLYHFDDRFASKCKFDIYTDEYYSWHDTINERSPEWRGYIPPADIPSLTQLLGYHHRPRRLDAYLYQRTDLVPEIRQSFVSAELKLCTSFTCRGELAWQLDDQTRDLAPRIRHDSYSIPSREPLSNLACPAEKHELPALFRQSLPLVCVIAPLCDETDTSADQIPRDTPSFQALKLDTPGRPLSYPWETRQENLPDITSFAAHRSLPLQMGALAKDSSAIMHDCAFLSDEISAGFRSLQVSTCIGNSLRQKKRTPYLASSPFPNELGLKPALAPRRYIPPETSRTLSPPASFRIDSSAASHTQYSSERDSIGRHPFGASIKRALLISPPPFDPPHHFGMAPFLIHLTLPKISWQDLPFKDALPPKVFPPSPSTLCFRTPVDSCEYISKKDAFSATVLKRPPSISVFFKPMTWSFRNLEFCRITQRVFETRSVFPAAWSPEKINVYCGLQRLHSDPFEITDIDYSDQSRLLRLPVLQLLPSAGTMTCATWLYAIVDIDAVKAPPRSSRHEFRNLYQPDNQFPLPDFGKRPHLSSPDPVVSTPARPLAIDRMELALFALDIRKFPLSGYQPPETRIHEISEPYHFLSSPACLTPSSRLRRLSVADVWYLLEAPAWGDTVSRLKPVQHKPAQLHPPDLTIIKPYARPAVALPRPIPTMACDSLPIKPRSNFRMHDRQPSDSFLSSATSPGPFHKRVFPLELLARRSQLPYTSLSGIDMLYSCLMERCRKTLYGPIAHNEIKFAQVPRFWRDRLAVTPTPFKASAHEIAAFFSCPDRIRERAVRRQSIMISRVRDLREAINLTQASVDRLSSPTPS